MHKIIKKNRLSENVFDITVSAPLIAEERQAGQFVIVQADNEFSERIPLTIVDADAEKGTIRLIFAAIGASTRALARLKEDDEIVNILGPLGKPTHIENFGRVVCVGGGIGTAPLYPIVKALKAAGNHVTVIIGARTAELIILEPEMRAAADNVIIVTDDGSRGEKGVVTAPLKRLCESPAEKPNFVVTIGPAVMMKFCAQTTKPFNIPTIASLNTIMIDGTGMCGGCRVSVGGKTQFVCVDGPEFDAHQVDFDNMMLRLGSFKKEEEHKCRIGLST